MSLWPLQHAQHAFQDGREADGPDERPQGSDPAMGLIKKKKSKPLACLSTLGRMGTCFPDQGKKVQKAAQVLGSHLEQQLFPNLLNHAPACFGRETCK